MCRIAIDERAGDQDSGRNTRGERGAEQAEGRVIEIERVREAGVAGAEHHQHDAEQQEGGGTES